MATIFMRNLILLLLFFSSAKLAYGQFDPVLMPRASVNMIYLENDWIRGNSFGAGWQLGVAVQGKIHERFLIAPELSYITKKKTYTTISESNVLDRFEGFVGEDIDLGGMEEFIDMTATTTTNGMARLGYWELALPISYVLFDNFYIMAGPYLDFLFTAAVREESLQRIPALEAISEDALTEEMTLLINLLYPNVGEIQQTEHTNKGSFRSLDMGFTGGFHYTIRKTVDVGLRYSRGFFDYRANPKEEKPNVHQVFHLSLAYFIPLKKKFVPQPQI